jgi:Skp family chaperone for outer membrane proteins
MQAIAGNVIRDWSRQRLSAAFNINTPIMDDRGIDRDKPVAVTGHTEIARLAIELASSGDFDKVTLDGAIDGKSVPFLQQMNSEDLIDFVHRAHEKGLETYISAGMDASNIGEAVRIGIGGVGMGIRLHEDNQVKEITHIKKDALEVLRKRNEAMTETAGKSAALLAKLDWLRSREAITQTQDEGTDDLFVQLKEYHRSSGADREAKERLTGKLNRLYGELSEVVEEAAEKEKQGETRGPGDDFDPIFAIAAARVKADEIKGKETDPELNFYLERRDAESLKCLMGYQ